MARRNFHERVDVLDRLSNLELLERYRLYRNGILFLSNTLEHLISPVTLRNHCLSPTEKVLITLRYLATTVIQLNDSEIHMVSQPTVSRAVEQVTDALSQQEIFSNFVRFPTSVEKLRQNKESFYNIGNFPNVIGVIDGTHIAIQAPHAEEPVYVNRMSYHSINTQICFDPDYRVIDIVVRWPDSTHDSRILPESGLFQLTEGGFFQEEHKYLLGDSGYLCKRWLLTPYQNPQGRAQLQYNIAHKRTRSIVERGTGQLKRRWGIFNGEIKVKPLKAGKIIMSCAVLHNICKDRQIPMLDELQDVNLRDDVNPYIGPEGLRYRDFVANTFL